jgi:hypothetical protein
MKAGFWDYVREAFSARPLGMFVPPNWIGIGAFGLLGLVDPGFLAIGLGLELAYLGLLATNERFQRYVGSLKQSGVRQDWQNKIEVLIAQLGPDARGRYRMLEVRCRAILQQQLETAGFATGLQAQGEGLGRLLWMYLRLLLMRQSIEKVLEESGANRAPERLNERIADLQARLKDETVGDELKKSLEGQIEILQQRVQKRAEAGEKLAFLDAELMRIQEQVELIREQAVLSTDPQSVSQRIDQITATLGGTRQWMQEQQRIYGAVEDLLEEPPPLTAGISVKE